MASRAQPLKMGNHQVQGLADGVDASDAVNKGQLDAAIGGITATVSSVAVSGGTTGLTTSGGPITTSGTITLAGTLGAANGGTGAASLTLNNVILGNGTSAVQFVAPGTSGNVLTSNGTTWASAAPSAAWNIAKKTSDQALATSSTTFQDVTSLSFTAAANKTYSCRALIIWGSAASAGGFKVAVNGPASPTRLVTISTSINVTAYDTTIEGANSQAFTTTYGSFIHFILKNGANSGTVIIRAAQNVSNASATTIYAGSYLEYVEIA